ncbi:RND transporter, partial [Flagellimonas olearia]
RDTNALMERGLSRIADMVNHRRGPAVVLGACVLLMLATAYYAQGIQIGDASPGSTVFWQDSEYNQDAAAITQRFLGADHLFVAVASDEPDTLKQPAVLQHMSDFQREIGLFPEVAANV